MQIALKEKPKEYDAIQYNGTLESLIEVCRWLECRGVAALYNPLETTIEFSTGRDQVTHWFVLKDNWIVDMYDRKDRFCMYTNTAMASHFEAV